jgi:hypothetical protein
LILQNNGADNLSIAANTPFTFATPLLPGSPYHVTILTPPGGQFCFVLNGDGTIAAANVQNVEVHCGQLFP